MCFLFHFKLLLLQPKNEIVVGNIAVEKIALEKGGGGGGAITMEVHRNEMVGVEERVGVRLSWEDSIPRSDYLIFLFEACYFLCPW